MHVVALGPSLPCPESRACPLPRTLPNPSYSPRGWLLWAGDGWWGAAEQRGWCRLTSSPLAPGLTPFTHTPGGPDAPRIRPHPGAKGQPSGRPQSAPSHGSPTRPASSRKRPPPSLSPAGLFNPDPADPRTPPQGNWGLQAMEVAWLLTQTCPWGDPRAEALGSAAGSSHTGGPGALQRSRKNPGTLGVGRPRKVLLADARLTATLQ